MTFKEFVQDLTKEMKEHPEWEEKELDFATINRSGMVWLSIYSDEPDSDKLIMDIGTAEDDEENNEAMSHITS